MACGLGVNLCIDRRFTTPYDRKRLPNPHRMERIMKRCSCLWAWVVCLAGFVAAEPAAAGEPEWKVGLARVKITPEQPVFLAGYASRTKPFEKVATDLYAKALVIEDRKGFRVALVTSDLIGFPAAVAEPICKRIQDKTGLKREQIMLNVSHTHTGPMVSLDATAGDNLSAGDALRVVEYTKQLQDRV